MRDVSRLFVNGRAAVGLRIAVPIRVLTALVADFNLGWKQIEQRSNLNNVKKGETRCNEIGS